MRRFLVAVVTIGSVIAPLGGCVDQGAGPQPRKVDPGYVGKHLLQAPPPALTAKLDVELGGKVIYLGNHVNVQRAVPGAAFIITHYWKVIAPIGPGWQVFSMLRGEPTKPDFMNLPPTDMQRAHGPATWAAGEIIEDEQEVFLRPDWRSFDATLYVGLIQTGAHGVGDRMAASGPNVVDRAVVARRLEIDLSRAPPPAGTLHVPYAQGPIAIDGSPTDQGWVGIAPSGEWPTAEGSPEPVGKAIGRLTWDDQHLYVYANVTDNDVFSEFKNQDDPLWKQDAVELFIDADGNRRGYVELQVNPNNATFDSWFPAGRAAKGDEEWDSGMITAVKLNPGQGWEVEIAIPWAAVKGRDEAMNVKLPPQVGDRWRMNVVRVDKKQDAKNPTASSWNRITYQDWHGLDRMLTVVFADVAGGVAVGSPARPVAPGVDPGAGSASGSAAGSASGSAAGSASGSAAGSATAAPPAAAGPSITLEVLASGAVRVNGVVIADADLGNLFRAAFMKDRTTRVMIAADPGAPPATIVGLIDRAKAAGLMAMAIAPTKSARPAAVERAAGSGVPTTESAAGSGAPAATGGARLQIGAGSGSGIPAAGSAVTGSAATGSAGSGSAVR